MSLNRIQKLLFSDYSDFEDMVLVESPFAQTTRDGQGLRQVQLGLTPTKLVLAVDVLPSADTAEFYCASCIDPEIETFELIAVYPVECVNLSVFRRRKRQSLKARFTNNRVLYFELGGFEKRNMFWNLWCERVKFLCPEDLESLKSETSVATSSSNSSLSNKKVSKNGKQIWCKYGEGDPTDRRYKWLDKYLFLGNTAGINPSFLDLPPTLKTNIEPTQSDDTQKNSSGVLPNQSRLLKINRFGKDVKEGCSTGLFLPAENYIVANRFTESSSNSTDMFTLYPLITQNHHQLSEFAVQLWESRSQDRAKGIRSRHPRKYGLAPLPHFLYGLGPWEIDPGDRYSVQRKRCSSTVRIRRQPTNPDLRLSVAKRLLTISVSCEAFYLDKNARIGPATNKLQSSKNSMLLFWTPEYWYKPQIAHDAYSEFMEQINKIHEFHEKKKLNNKDTKNSKKKTTKSRADDIRDCLDEKYFEKIFMSATSLINKNPKPPKASETPVQKMKRLLRMEVASTAWDFDSTTIAYQLTLIDTELFNKIPENELSNVVWQQTTDNAPNISSLIAFSHRISCLTVTEILRDDSDKMRAQLIVRFINIADKCDSIGNYHSCKSILNGLQCPAVYRLHRTWSYIRQHHAIKYHTFEKLSRLHNDPTSKIYQHTFHKVMKNSPFLPFIGDILSRLLDKVPLFKTRANELLSNIPGSRGGKKYKKLRKDFAKKTLKKYPPEHYLDNQKTTFSKFHKLLSVFKMSQTHNEISNNFIKLEKHTHSIPVITPEEAQTIIKYFDPIYSYEDNRKERLLATSEFLGICKKASMKYGFNIHELARQYLLKARYREELENFMISFKLEPKQCS